jgi:hypothetical protein
MESDRLPGASMHSSHTDAAALWVLFDEAVTTANAALEREGLPERITVEGSGTERRYTLAGTAGRAREIKVTFAAGPEDEAFAGSAFIGFSYTRACIRLVSAIAGSQMRWFFASQGAEFTADIVHDLFLSVFGDDPLATFRLSPMAGAELFETPWA